MTVSVHTDGPVAFVEIDNPPVNAASSVVRAGLIDALAQTEANAAVQAVVLLCAGRTFVAGADVREFGKPAVEPVLPDVVLALEGTTKPWIAALHGSALGGGLEIALGCAYRVAVPDAKMGLPEVTLGLLPGAGGTVRLPRLIGAVPALDMMAGGKPVSAVRALALGLLDAVLDGDLRAGAKAFALTVIEAKRPVPLTARDMPAFDADALDKRIAAIQARARGQNSPKAICAAVLNATQMSAVEALAAERALFLRLKDDPQSQALRHIFFAERSVGKSLPEGSALQVTHVGVVGGGTMGAGIASAALLAGLRVTMVERDPDAVAMGHARVAEVLDGSLKRGVLSEDGYARCLERFSGSVEYSALADADLVIEAVFEDMDVKHDAFKALDTVVKPEAVLATNTSYLDVGQIAQAVARPARVIGLHFFSPAYIMKLLELVIPLGADPDAVATGAALGKRLGKITVPSGVCDGFIGNRIMSAYRRSCEYMIEDGALPQQVDQAMRSFGFPMGIFEMQDLAGLDISWAMRKRQAATRNPEERYVDIADQLCERGRFGRKAGRGWYLYDGKTAQVDPQVTALIEETSARKGITRVPLSENEIMERILHVMQAEGRAIVAEEIAARAEDIDVVMVNGYGFPRWRGGPMFMAAEQGANT